MLDDWGTFNDIPEGPAISVYEKEGLDAGVVFIIAVPFDGQLAGVVTADAVIEPGHCAKNCADIEMKQANRVRRFITDIFRVSDSQ